MDEPTEVSQPMAASREMVRMMGRIFSTGEMYGPQHRATTDAMEKCYGFVAPILDVAGRIDFIIVNGMMIIEGGPIETTDAFINTLARWLGDVDLSGLSLLKGLTHEEFGKLIEIMFSGVPIASEEGEGMRQALATYGIEHVRTQKVTVRTVTEQQEVVLKSEETAADCLGDGSVIAQIAEFLKGDVAVDAELYLKNMKAMLLSTPERLACLIMESATMQATESMPGGELESLTDMVIARLEQIRDALLNEPASKTKKRQSDLKKSLLLLGKAILGDMQSFAAPVDPEHAMAAIKVAIEEMLGELEIQAMAAECAKKRASLARSEKGIVRRIKAIGAEQAAGSSLGESLIAEGVTAGDWQRLLVKGGGSGAHSDAVSGIVAELAKLDEMLRIGQPETDAINGVMSRMTGEVRTLAGQAEQQIEDFGKQIQQLDETITGSKDPEQVKRAILSRKALVALLADIVEKLCQPVTVMSTAIQMTVGGYLGPINKQQKETLEMGVENGERATQLLHKLIDIVGIPNCPPSGATRDIRKDEMKQFEKWAVTS